MQRSSCLEALSIEAAMVSGVQGLDPKKKFSALYRVSEGKGMY